MPICPYVRPLPFRKNRRDASYCPPGLVVVIFVSKICHCFCRISVISIIFPNVVIIIVVVVVVVAVVIVFFIIVVIIVVVNQLRLGLQRAHVFSLQMICSSIDS